MIGKDKYQYLLSEIHELNRENLLIEQENNERIFNELHKISDKLNTYNQKKEPTNKIFNILLVILILNLLVSFFLVFYINFKISENNSSELTIENTDKKKDPKKEPSESNLSEDLNTKSIKTEDDVIIFEENKVLDQNFVNVTPLIKKDTKYKCEDDGYQVSYKIPYKTEIKGKLYNDRFEFILQQNKETKKCNINKSDM